MTPTAAGKTKIMSRSSGLKHTSVTLAYKFDDEMTFVANDGKEDKIENDFCALNKSKVAECDTIGCQNEKACQSTNGEDVQAEESTVENEEPEWIVSRNPARHACRI
jgi:hypothetical protein